MSTSVYLVAVITDHPFCDLCIWYGDLIFVFVWGRSFRYTLIFLKHHWWLLNGKRTITTNSSQFLSLSETSHGICPFSFHQREASEWTKMTSLSSHLYKSVLSRHNISSLLLDISSPPLADRCPSNTRDLSYHQATRVKSLHLPL